ncbi:FAA hydrolase family protein [Bacillus sp. FJAT-42376]|uniref:fumarylacetoacetate hydrolase family protein n=1 Tax=Bacillus sp. FJAT-42376 TaxID=2014076 RepID=UPI000F4FFD55|nr:fumarylacetoacetate hydrolase family protein [Bacillus sp. FJAT-42376]AZB42288.1 FAA hydrolase family protein [Bacillus sp. FJAT-42376]
MKFASARLNGRTFIGLIQNEEQIFDLQRAEKKFFEMETISGNLEDCILDGDKFISQAQVLEQRLLKSDDHQELVYSLSDVDLLAPIPRPRKNVFCVGKNYREHAVEMGSEADIPKFVMLFSKAPTSVIGHGDLIDPHTHITQELDYEGELAVIIGKKGKQISVEDALDYVFGYSIVNDITARNLQANHKQFLLGKSLDTSCPFGPFIVHKSAIPDPHDLHIETRVNGEIRQTGYTGDMIFSIASIISTISQGTTLEPGDIIATGTPSGVGKGFNPPKFLKSGDMIEISISGIGTLENGVN